jgi:hypothetical protein
VTRGLTLQLVLFTFTTILIGLSLHLQTLALQVLQDQQVRREKHQQLLALVVQQVLQVQQVRKEILDLQVHKVYMLQVLQDRLDQQVLLVPRAQKDSAAQLVQRDLWAQQV